MADDANKPAAEELKAKKPFESSYKRMMLDMAKGFFDANDIDSKNAALVHATIVYVKATRLHTAVDESGSDLVESKQVLKSILGKLKDAGNNIATQNAKLYSQDAEPLFVAIDEIELKRDSIKTSFIATIEKIFANLKGLLDRALKSDNVNNILKDQISQNILSYAEQAIAAQETEFKNLTKNTSKYQESIDRTITSAFHSLPPTQKQEVAPALPRTVQSTGLGKN